MVTGKSSAAALQLSFNLTTGVVSVKTFTVNYVVSVYNRLASVHQIFRLSLSLYA